MIEATIYDTAGWSRAQWQGVDLHDPRLDRRAIEIGQRLAQQPAAGFPQAMGDWNNLEALYRFLDNPKVSFASLEKPVWQLGRELAGREPLVLLVMDVTELDLSHLSRTMSGLGPIGDGRGRGVLLHSTLAIVPGTRRVIGLAHQQVFQRVPTPAGQNRRQRPKAERESRIWAEAVRAIGQPPAGSRWVVVGDAATDNLDFLSTCRDLPVDFTLRLTYDHRLVDDLATPSYLFSTARAWPAVAHKTVAVTARSGHSARQAQVAISFGEVVLRSRPHSRQGLAVWLVRAWEVGAPADVEPLEWFLATTVAVTTPEEALERLDWYSTRWVVEDYHQCLKTGCRIEHRDLEQAVRLERLLGLLAPVAVRLLQLRQEARQTPEQPAAETVDPWLIQVLAQALSMAAEGMTVYTFWRRVAQLGGFLGRRHDGEPGWKTIWQGWQMLTTMAKGAALNVPKPP